MTTIPDAVARDLATWLRSRFGDTEKTTAWADLLDPSMRDLLVAAVWNHAPFRHPSQLVDAVLAIVRAEIAAVECATDNGQAVKDTILALFSEVTS